MLVSQKIKNYLNTSFARQREFPDMCGPRILRLLGFKNYLNNRLAGLYVIPL